MNAGETDGLLAKWDAIDRRNREYERLRIERDSLARLCANAVNDGDMAAAVDWAEEYALTVGKQRPLVGDETDENSEGESSV